MSAIAVAAGVAKFANCLSFCLTILGNFEGCLFVLVHFALGVLLSVNQCWLLVDGVGPPCFGYRPETFPVTPSPWINLRFEVIQIVSAALPCTDANYFETIRLRPRMATALRYNSPTARSPEIEWQVEHHVSRRVAVSLTERPSTPCTLGLPAGVPSRLTLWAGAPSLLPAPRSRRR